MHVSERTGSNGYRKRRRQGALIGGRRPYSAAGCHTKKEVILGGREPYSAAGGDCLFYEATPYYCYIACCAKIVMIAVLCSCYVQ
jgi:hypothetical protein